MSDRYQDLLFAAAEEILLLVDPESLVILAANPAASRLLGYPAGSLTGQPVTEIECALTDLFFWEEVRAGGGTEEQAMEGLYRRADDSLLSARKTVRRIPEGILVRATDIGAQKRAEDQLALMASRLRATLEATADGILVLDRHGHITNMNRRLARLWNLPEDLLARHDDDAILQYMADAVDGGTDLHALLTRHSQDVKETFDTLPLRDGRIFEASSRPARHDEEVIGRVFCITDVTERHKAEQALIAARDAANAANRAKSDFLAMMSHEIRTPMNGIIGMAQLLEMSPHTPEQQEYIATIQSSGDALLGIINDILDYSKIEARKLSLEKIGFDLRPLVADVEKLFRARAAEKSIVFTAMVADSVPRVVVGDPTRLRQILMNLVGNAFKFTARGQIGVHVTSTPVGPGRINLRVTVSDTGIGIAADKCTHIFTPFEQADMSTTRRYGGTGLGLAICRMLCELMGGEIGVDSEEGVGSRFWFTAELETGVGEESHTPDAPRAILRQSTRILVVEDNPINRTVLTRMLERFGAHDVAFAEDGEDALKRCAEADYELIFMDARMPRLDGLAATRQLRERSYKAYIIGVSADAMPEERRDALAAGMDDYVIKPVARDALAAAIERWRQTLIAAYRAGLALHPPEEM
ncbi:ATP-binding protein [Zoogloea sp.]|uniref:PAS domain-containing hybrid sensor histidine kinase/response regulator n=1 Tax=Zoogloea sp. TaxID=49181 RepID=UPI0035B351A7